MTSPHCVLFSLKSLFVSLISFLLDTARHLAAAAAAGTLRASLGAQLVKNLPSMRETWVRSLGWEDPLEKGKATHSSILACSQNTAGL